MAIGKSQSIGEAIETAKICSKRENRNHYVIQNKDAKWWGICNPDQWPRLKEFFRRALIVHPDGSTEKVR